MPRRIDASILMESLPDAERNIIHSRHHQAHWYRMLAGRCAGLTVLDVGAGSGYGTEIMTAAGATVKAIDPAPSGPLVSDTDIMTYPDGSFDVVVAVDVIEHVGDAVAFLGQMRRVARRWVFFSTPNWNVSRCENIYHVREFTPAELMDLLSGLYCDFWESGEDLAVRRIERPSDLVSVPNFGVFVRMEAR